MVCREQSLEWGYKENQNRVRRTLGRSKKKQRGKAKGEAQRGSVRGGVEVELRDKLTFRLTTPGSPQSIPAKNSKASVASE